MRCTVLAIVVVTAGCDSSDFELSSINGSWIGTVEFAQPPNCSVLADYSCYFMDLTLSLHTDGQGPHSRTYVSGAGSFSYHRDTTTTTGTVEIVGENYWFVVTDPDCRTPLCDPGHRIDVSDYVTDDGHFYLKLRFSPSPTGTLSFTGECRDNTLSGQVSGFGGVPHLVMTRQ